MIRQILILLWNRRRKMAWVFTEQTLVFIVLALCFTSISGTLKQYYEPGKITGKDVASVGYSPTDAASSGKHELKEYSDQFMAMTKTFDRIPGVQYLSYMSPTCIPATGSRSMTDSVMFSQKKYLSAFGYCDENYFRMFGLQLQSGRWLTDSEPVDGIPETVITQKLADRIDGKNPLLGKTIHFQNREFRIVGVVKAFKRLDVGNPKAIMFLPFYLYNNDSELQNGWEVLIQYQKGMFPDLSKEFLKQFHQNFTFDEAEPVCLELNSLRNLHNFFEFLNVYLLCIPTAFLIIFAFLGTFGLIWMQSEKRFDEFGLRLALGSTPAQLKWYVILESLLLTTFAMLPGLIVMANLYAFAPKGWEWIAAVIAAIVLMWLFAAFSAWYPARQAAKVQPVEALRANQ